MSVKYKNIKEYNSAYLLLDDYFVDEENASINKFSSKRLVYLPTQYT